MDALDEAKEALASWFDGSSDDDFLVAKAQAYAAIAQAEALQLIAKRIEQWMSVQGVLPEFFEYIERHKIREAIGHTEQIHSE